MARSFSSQSGTLADDRARMRCPAQDLALAKQGRRTRSSHHVLAQDDGPAARGPDRTGTTATQPNRTFMDHLSLRLSFRERRTLCASDPGRQNCGLSNDSIPLHPPVPTFGSIPAPRAGVGAAGGLGALAPVRARIRRAKKPRPRHRARERRRLVEHCFERKFKQVVRGCASWAWMAPLWLPRRGGSRLTAVRGLPCNVLRGRGARHGASAAWPTPACT